MYQALYRKWRPKTFSDVTGQTHITETLQRQVAEGRTSHAYLFTGTRGTGKTTCAKILAKAVNCEQPVDGNPCNRCPSCLGIENGSFLDVLELDAASNNGVDQVRALRDEAIYSPANVKKRVYIIDEVHMLSISAFNALLKILEEPPEHLMFILATTELHKVPATILSRCQRFSFRRIRPQDIAARLSYVSAQEGIPLTPDGAELLSRLADGALRDALSLLDQCAAAGGTVDSRAVLDILGLAGGLQTAQLMDAVARRDTEAALLQLDQLYNGGKDVGAILNELSTLVRDLLLCKTAPEGGAALLSGGFDSATLEQLEKGLSASRLLYLANTLQQASANLYYSANRRTDAELCLLRLCDESLSGDLTALTARMTRLEERMAVLPSAIRTQQESTAAPVPNRPAKAAPVRSATPTQKAPAEEEERPPLPEEPPLDPQPVMPWDDEAPVVPKEEPPTPTTTAVSHKKQSPDEENTQPAAAVPAPSIPTPSRAKAAPAPSAGGFQVWRELAESCKGRLPPMYRVFLDLCSGCVTDGIVSVYAPDDITKGRLDNERVLSALREQGQQLTGAEVDIRLLVGTPPTTATPEQLREELLQLSSQFDNIQIQ